jgi:hypothetical protein
MHEIVIELIEEHYNKKEDLYMNEVVKKAKEIMEANSIYEQDLPNLEIGAEVTLSEVWDGNGEVPEDSYSYKIANEQWINYEFEFTGYKQVTKTEDHIHYTTAFEKEEGEERSLDSIVRITNIELL